MAPNPLAVRMTEEGLDWKLKEDYARLCWVLLAENYKYQEALELIETGDQGHAGVIARKALEK